ncbi:hypothetical protein [Vibrio sp. LaRot3]|uniref:hypothetical protein n=1 Tax=Vibrio sp. LaRot3 TaxID=2998829 RepID=UPI0022CDC4B4|nr:hypothetical protein [Vibrio sp. LaRot3]MDA0147104.1 hypothetical protein [Vibrio sp. LaRot3]
MLFKLLFLFAALKLHDVRGEPVKPTLLYCVPLLVLALVFGSALSAVVIQGAVMMCVAFVYFGLLTKFNHGVEYFAIMILGGALQILFV